MLLPLFLVFVVLAVILYFVLAHDGMFINNVCYLFDKNRFSSGATPNICTSPGCVRTAHAVLNSMDVKIDPCTDFDRFVCGNYAKHNIIPEGVRMLSPIFAASDLISLRKRTLVQEEIRPSDPVSFVRVKKMYKACMNIDQIEANAVDTLRTIIDRLGGWPLLDGDHWNVADNDNSWTNIITRMNRNGYADNYLIATNVMPITKLNTIMAVKNTDFGECARLRITFQF